MASPKARAQLGLACGKLELLLPCHVIVHEHRGTSAVAIGDPAWMLGVIGDNAAVMAVAEEAAVRLRRVVAALGEGSVAAAHP